MNETNEWINKWQSNHHGRRLLLHAYSDTDGRRMICAWIHMYLRMVFCSHLISIWIFTRKCCTPCTRRHIHDNKITLIDSANDITAGILKPQIWLFIFVLFFFFSQSALIHTSTARGCNLLPGISFNVEVIAAFFPPLAISRFGRII